MDDCCGLKRIRIKQRIPGLENAIGKPGMGGFAGRKRCGMRFLVVSETTRNVENH